jgi:hypothetical protein
VCLFTLVALLWFELVALLDSIAVKEAPEES